MKVRPLRKLRRKAKARTGIRYENGYYRAYKRNCNHHTSYTGGVKKLEVAIEDLAKFRRNLILNWVNNMKGEMEEERINKEIRNL